MSKITFEFAPEPNAWGCTIVNDGVQPPQLLMIARMKPRVTRTEVQADRYIVTGDFPKEASLNGLITIGNDITNEQLAVVAEWAEIMAERGFAMQIMTGEAAAQREKLMTNGSGEDDIEMLKHQIAAEEGYIRKPD